VTTEFYKLECCVRYAILYSDGMARETLTRTSQPKMHALERIEYVGNENI